MDIVRVDALAWQKNPKRHFFGAIGNPFHEVTWIGLEPHQIFSFCNISTNMVARGVQSFGLNGPWLAGHLSYGQNFFLKFAQTCDEQMLKISRRYLDSSLSNDWITEKLLSLLPPQWTLWPLWGQKWPLWWQVAQKFFSHCTVSISYDIMILSLLQISIGDIILMA